MNWLPGEPNDSGNNEDCSEMFYSSGYHGKWNDLSCTAMRAHVCKK